MSERYHIQVRTREATGKNSNRRLRSEGQIPAVLYGAAHETVPIQVERRKVEEVFRAGATENTIFLLKRLESDQERHARIREIQIDPVSREVLHIDFQRVLMDQAIQVEVPIQTAGTPTGVKDEGGVLEVVTREVAVECLPGDIPEVIEVDVSALAIGDHIEAGALKLPEKVTLIEEPDRVIVSVAYAARIEEPEEEEAEELLEAEREEPEVIRRGKEEEEEAEEEG
ncbi:MAG TPA: 50S ribosomal protein L25 [Thermoanaerobaculia bacterium]|nr:50S ribosomal protein L25 [Thermoanaerobaculia bacterium]